MEPRRAGPLTVEATLGGTADLALSAGLESVGGEREGDEDEMRFGLWDGVLVAVVAIIYQKWGYVGIVQTDQTYGLEVTLRAKKWGRRRGDVLDHVQNRATDEASASCIGGNTCAMTTIADPLDDLNSNSLFAVRVFCFSVLISH